MNRAFLRRSHSSRAMALALIVALHGAALAVGLSMKGPRPDPVVQDEPIVVSFIAENRSRFAVSPRGPDPTLLSVAPQPLSPTVQITLPPDPPPTQEASFVPEPQSAPSASASGDGQSGSHEPALVSDADYLQLPRVVYPPAARRARAQGMVHVRALVDEEGKPAEVSIARSSGFELLDGAACSAVREARFKPYRRNNIARSMVVIVPIEFSIRSRS